MISGELNEKLIGQIYVHGPNAVRVLTPEGEILEIKDVTYDSENECFFIQSDWYEEDPE